MSQFLIQDSTLQDIGDAVRSNLSTPVSFTYPIVVSTYSDYFWGSPDSTDIKPRLDNIAASANIEPSYYKIKVVSSGRTLTIAGTVVTGNTTKTVSASSSTVTVSVSGYSSSNINYTLKIIPLDADQNPFEDMTGTSTTTGTKVYTSDSTLPVSQLAAIINKIADSASGGGANVKIYSNCFLVPAGNSNYQSDANLDVMTSSSLWKKPVTITQMSQIAILAWADRDYIYYTAPARDGANNLAPIYYCRLGNNSWSEYTTYSTKFLFKTDSTYFWVNTNNTPCNSLPAILVYT